MNEPHALVQWADGIMDIPAIAEAAGCSEWHLRNIIAGRREASLGLAKRLSDITQGVVPMDAFLRPAASQGAIL
jgi:hypothetical protein